MGQEVCQFYIVLGDKEFRPPSDGNVYINATGVLDNRLIYDSIMRAYAKKSGENIAVANEIVFLVANENFKARCQEIISELRIRGSIQILPAKKVERESQSIDLSKPKLVSEDNPKVVEGNDDKKIVNIVDYKQDKELSHQTSTVSTVVGESTQKKSVDYSYKPDNASDDKVIYADFGSDIERTERNDIARTNSKPYTRVKKLDTRSKSAAFVSLPVIIFILSALLLIVSAVLLFIVEWVLEIELFSFLATT